MRLLSKINIKVQVIVGFSVLILFIVFQGATSYRGVKEMSSLIDDIFNHPFQVSNAVKEIHSTINGIHRDMKDIASTNNQNEILILTEEIDKHEREVYGLFELTKGNYLGDSADVTNALESFKAWKPIRDNVISFSRSGKNNEAFSITTGRGAKHVNHLISLIDKLEDFANQKANEFYTNANSLKKSIVINLLSIGFFIFIISIVVSTIVIRSINHTISEREKYEQKLKEGNKALEAKNKELEQFTYITSHDLQEPLNSILSFSILLRQNNFTKLDKIGKQSISIIEESSKRMKEFIRSLLEYSRIGRVKEKSAVNIKKMVTNVKNDLHDLVEREDATIKYIGEDITINAFEIELIKLFQNIIINAIRYRKEEEAPFVVINSKELENEYEFTVSDNGIGIEKEHYDKIFEVFRRLHTRDKYEGTGIGLAYCKKIVELHHGRIWLDSTPGKGTKFYFSISKN